MALIKTKTVRIRNKAEKRLEQYHRPSKDFFILTIIAAAIAALGLILDNTAIIVGAMVVAPLITPVFGFSLSLMLLRWVKVCRSLLSIFLGTVAAVFTSMLVAYLVILFQGNTISLTNEIIARGESGLLFFLVALLSGMAGAYAYAKPNILESFAGIAISVAVIPPLAVVGIAIALNQWELATQSFLLYLFNLAGICFGSIVMFLALGFGKDIEK